jgi:hypothetical protein
MEGLHSFPMLASSPIWIAYFVLLYKLKLIIFFFTFLTFVDTNCLENNDQKHCLILAFAREAHPSLREAPCLGLVASFFLLRTVHTCTVLRRILIPFDIGSLLRVCRTHQVFIRLILDEFTIFQTNWKTLCVDLSISLPFI